MESQNVYTLLYYDDYWRRYDIETDSVYTSEEGLAIRFKDILQKYISDCLQKYTLSIDEATLELMEYGMLVVFDRTYLVSAAPLYK